MGRALRPRVARECRLGIDPHPSWIERAHGREPCLPRAVGLPGRNRQPHVLRLLHGSLPAATRPVVVLTDRNGWTPFHAKEGGAPTRSTRLPLLLLRPSIDATRLHRTHQTKKRGNASMSRTKVSIPPPREWASGWAIDAEMLGREAHPRPQPQRSKSPVFRSPPPRSSTSKKETKKASKMIFRGIYVDVLLVLRIRSRNARREGATFRRTSAPCFGSKDGLGNGRKVLHVLAKRAGRKASGCGAQEDEPGRQEAELGLDGHGRRRRRAFACLGHLL